MGGILIEYIEIGSVEQEDHSSVEGSIGIAGITGSAGSSLVFSPLAPFICL